MKPVDSLVLRKNRWYCTPRNERFLLVFADVSGFFAAFTAATFAWLIINQSSSSAAWKWWTVHGAIHAQAYAFWMTIALVTFWAQGHYYQRRPYSNEVRQVLRVCVVLTMLDATLVFLSQREFSRSFFLVNWSVVPVFVLLFRTGLKFLLLGLGGWSRPMVIVGWGDNALETALAFEGERLMGYSILAFLIPDDKQKINEEFRDRFGRLVPCIALGPKPEITIARLGDPHVVLALEQGGIETYQDIIQELGRRNRSIQIVPSIRGLPLYGMEANHFFAHEVLLLTVRNNLARRFPRFVKRVFDIGVSLTLLVLATPLLLWISLNVLRTGFPIFYGHQRQGQFNMPFACFKFRTMAPNAEKLLKELLNNDPAARAEWERDFKLKNDPRITGIGHFLRRTSLDELPQLWNVLKGDMSLVGPRPIVVAELERYGNQVEYYLEAKPGITGLWQISGRNDTSYETRVYLDAWYVRNWSLFNDIVILFRTIGVILRRSGAY
jgi:undecaprenyl-phosphate galactose phosphotransferase